MHKIHYGKGENKKPKTHTGILQAQKSYPKCRISIQIRNLLGREKTLEQILEKTTFTRMPRTLVTLNITPTCFLIFVAACMGVLHLSLQSLL